MANSNISIKVMGDDLIKKNSSGIVYNATGYKTKQTGRPSGEPGGLYDPKIFGQKNVCDCGRMRSPGHTCEFCGTYVFNDDVNRMQYGIFILPIHMVNTIMFKKFSELLKGIIPTYFYNSSREISGINYVWNTKIIPIEVDDVTQDKEGVFVLRKVDNKLCRLEIGFFDESDPSTYYGYYGFEGLYNLFNSYTPTSGSFDAISKYITELLIIGPTSMRPISRTPSGNIQYPSLTSMYSSVITVSKLYAPIIKDPSSSLADRLACSYALNNIVDLGYSEYNIIGSSKESLIRNALSTRLAKSGRANIISTDVPINTVKLPRGLAYEALKSDIIEEIRNRYPAENAEMLYNNPKDEVLEIFKEIAENSVVVINRQPTLHKFSALAFHVQLWDEKDMIGAKDAATLGMNVQICTPFNADFDGDQMQFWFATKEPMKTEIYEKMGVEHNWIYDKNDKPVFTFQKGLIAGLYYASKPEAPNDVNNIKEYDSLTELYSDYKYGVISHSEQVKFDGRITSYGRERIREILGRDPDIVIGAPVGSNTPIDGKNVDKLVIAIQDDVNRVEIMNQLYLLSKEIVTIEGLSVAPSSELYKISTSYPEIDEIVNDKDMSEEEKWEQVEYLLPKLIKKRVESESPNLTEYNKTGSKIKPASLNAILGPQIEFKNGKLIKHDESLITGLSQDAFVHHVAANREILAQKATLVPQGGYLTTQLKNLCTDIILKGSDRKSNDTEGIITRMKYAVGRTTLDNKIIEPNSSPELVRVKSCLTAEDKTGFVVCMDEISTKFHKVYNKDGSMIGVSFVTGFTEALTQSSLALKHGGSVFKPNTNGLYSTTNKVVKEVLIDRIILESNNSLEVYPVPKNAIFSKNTNKGIVLASEENGHNPIYLLNRPVYVDYNIAATLKFLGAQSASGRDVNLNKTKIDLKHVYALESGKVHYDFEKKKVTTGNFDYPLYDDEAYLLPEGAEVQLGDRLCTGVSNPFEYEDKLTKAEVFFLTIRQLEDLGFKITSTESIEFILKTKYKTGKQSIITAVKNLDYISAAMGGYTKQLLSDAVDTTLADSLMLRLILDRGNLEGLGE